MLLVGQYQVTEIRKYVISLSGIQHRLKHCTKGDQQMKGLMWQTFALYTKQMLQLHLSQKQNKKACWCTTNGWRGKFVSNTLPSIWTEFSVEM